MKNLLFTLIFVSSCIFSNAQNMQLFDPVSNRTFNADKYTDIRGVPFLFDKWMKSKIDIDKGYYEGLQIKYDLYDNKLYFLKNEASLELQENVLSFTLYPKPDDATTSMFFKKGYKGNGLNADQFVQVVVDGYLQLIKSDIKSLSEMSEINAGMVKTFTTNTRYYMVSSKGTNLVRLNKSEILPFLQDKDAEVQAYILEKKLNVKKDSDLILVLQFYNKLYSKE
jgi:hypothetical protein